MTINGSDIDVILDELRSQGFLAKTHNELNSSWFIKTEGTFLGYVVTSDELIELKRENRLDLRGLKSLSSGPASKGQIPANPSRNALTDPT